MRVTLGIAAQAALTLGFAWLLFFPIDWLFRGHKASLLYLQYPCALFWGFGATLLVMALYIRVRFGAEAFRTSKAFWEL